MAIYTEAAAWLTYSAEIAAEVAGLQAGRPLDLVEFPEWGGEGYVHLLNQTEWNRVPAIVQIHGPIVMFAENAGWPEKNSELYRVGRMMEETSLRLADAVYSSSRHSAGWCARHYGLDESRIPVLHTGVDTELFRPGREPRQDPPTIVFVGRIDRQKGVDTLFEASCALAKEIPGLRLRLIGKSSSNLPRELERLARQRGFAELLEFGGYIGRDELPMEFARADVMAAPSAGEGGPGFVYLEAMACGLPVVACRDGGADESVVDGETGLLVSAGDAGELTAALRRLLADGTLRREMGARAREQVVAAADSRKCLGALEAFYKNVIATAGVESR
jgi:glycosyltransferase involved in cell wall biosynthesis